MWNNSKVYLVFVPGFWHRAPKTLRISWVIGVSFIIHHEQTSVTPEFISIRRLRMGPLGSLRLGLVTWKTKWLESELSAAPPYLQEGERELEIGLYKNSWTKRFRELPGWGTYPRAGRVTHPNSMGTETPVLGILRDLARCTSSSGWSFVAL